MIGDFPFTHDFARQRFANLDVVSTRRLRVQHRIEGGDLPDVCHAQLQTVREILNARWIEIAAFTLDDKHQRNDRRTFDRVLRQMPIDFGLNFSRKRSRRRHVHRMIGRLNFYEHFAHKDSILNRSFRSGPPPAQSGSSPTLNGTYRSISPKTISSDPMIATMSATIAPRDMCGSAERFTKLGPRK